MYQTKLVRKQVLLDKYSLDELEVLLAKSDLKYSFSEYLRNLIYKDLQNIKQNSTDNIDLLKSKAGFVKSGGFITKKAKLLAKKGFVKTSGDGLEAVNHNDIYKI
jgi:hypothetical protein